VKCIALDDEPLALRVIESYLRFLPEVDPIGFFTDPKEVESRIHNERIDLLFLDIEMPDVDGISFYQNLTFQPPVIFTTAYRNFAVEGFELNAVDYLVKPFDLPRFKVAIQRAQDMQTTKATQNVPENLSSIQVHSSYDLVKVSLDELYLVETYGDYLKLYLEGKDKPILTLMTLKTLEEKLPAQSFLRVHRSFLVARSAIEKRMGKVLIVKGQTVPIGRTHFQRVKKVFGP
jgi:two-component system LytT family response regulator